MKKNRMIILFNARYRDIINVLILIVIFQATSFGQEHDLYFNQINQSDGLSQTWNQFIYHDSKGFVWISSLNGINRYDGQQVIQYKHSPKDSTSIPDDYIQSGFVEDQSSDLWFTTYTSLVHYDRKNDIFEKVKMDNDISLNGSILAYIDSEDNLGIIVPPNKLYQFSILDKEWNLIDSFSNEISNICPLFDRLGNLKQIYAYSRTNKGLDIVTYNDKGLSEHSSRFDDLVKGEELIFWDVKVDKSKVLWAATSVGLLRMDTRDQESYELFKYSIEGVKINNFYQVELVGENQLFLSSNSNGLFVIDKKYPEEIAPIIIKGLSSEGVNLASKNTRSIYYDNSGIIWVNVNQIGVNFSHLDKLKFKIKKLSNKWEKVNIGISCITEDSYGDLWYSNRSNGIFRISSTFDYKEHYDKNINATLPTNEIQNLFVDKKNRCWALSYLPYLSRYDSMSNSFKKVLDDSYLYGLQLDKGPILFSPMTGGLQLFTEDDNGVGSFDFMDSVEKKYQYTRLFENKEGLVFGARDLKYIDVFDSKNHFELVHSIPVLGDILSFVEDTIHHVIWIGTSNGLIKLNESNWNIKIYTESSGMVNHNIYGILIDKDFKLWLSSNSGIIRFDSENEDFHNFDIPDGLQAYEFNRNSSLIQSNGIFIFGGPSGINYFNPDSLNYIEIPPTVQFTNIEVEDGAIELPPCAISGATNVSEIQKIKMRYDENTIKFEFAAMEYSNPEKNQFQYKMSSIDENWVEGGAKGSVRYANLRPGKYVFEVKAANSDGYWSKPKSMLITITPPFWQTWWFRLLMALAVAGIGYSGIRLFIDNKLRKQQFEFDKQELILKNQLQLQQERNRIADELHDELGGKLSTIKFAGKKVQRAKSIEEVKAITTRVSEISTELIDSMRAIIWAMDSHNDTLSSLLANIRSYASTLARDNDFEIAFDFPELVDEVEVKGQIRHHFYLIVKEILNNILKHSTKDKVWIVIRHQNKKLILSIKENGKGFSPYYVKQQGKGLQSINKRINLLDGDIEYLKGKLMEVKIEISL